MWLITNLAHANRKTQRDARLVTLWRVDGIQVTKVARIYELSLIGNGLVALNTARTHNRRLE